MTDEPEYRLALRQADQACADFYAIEDDLEFIESQLARLRTLKDLARSALMTIPTPASLTIDLMELFISRGL